ncbi:EpsG family protein [Peribacillus sp. SCS-37]|uniref:EpsG family protein n=1 Tax=Paraperibacillus esterisolvens TaxID=3115296 RepID=UPI0039065F05
MTVLWVNLILVSVCSFFSRYFAVQTSALGSYVRVRPNGLLIVGAVLSLILISGLRNSIGDTYYYMHAYSMHEFTWDFVKSQKDMGFGVFQMLLKKYSSDPQVLVFTTALITNVLIIVTLYKHSRMIELSIYVYITSGLYLVSMNGIRQMLAASIAFAATYFLFRRQAFYYILVVIIASTIHESALILIPAYFLSGYRAWSKSTIYLLGAAVLFAVGYNQISSFLFAAIQDSQYSHYENFSEGGANIIRVGVQAVPLIIAYLGRDKLRLINPYSDYIVNMSLMGFVFMIISTHNWIFARSAIYFSLYQLLLISWIILLFKKKEQRLVYFALLICYFAFYYYESVISLDVIYRSNFFSL